MPLFNYTDSKRKMKKKRDENLDKKKTELILSIEPIFRIKTATGRQHE